VARSGLRDNEAYGHCDWGGDSLYHIIYKMLEGKTSFLRVSPSGTSCDIEKINKK
jgi:hypothetical protein